MSDMLFVFGWSQSFPASESYYGRLPDGKNRTESNYGENYARKQVEHYTVIICVYVYNLFAFLWIYLYFVFVSAMNNYSVSN